MSLRQNGYMPRSKRTKNKPMAYLRAWRESLGLSRPAVANRIGTSADGKMLDQATLAKWESGESAVRVQDLELLAEVYGVTADRLFFPPGDERTPDLMKRAYEILTNANPEAVERWLALGKDIIEK
ncbi:helix-turn-helix domain-containing protein [Gluconobacter oxydans]|uniref:helix-turn-helix domain-containing protein n=1 Tax=Gluconobacter oxydans TaxID=442 RepID=UPI0039EC9F7F